VLLPKGLQSLKRSAVSDAIDLLIGTSYGRQALLGKYPYMFSPEQLWALCQAAESVLPLGGVYAEIGAYNGDTTVYLHHHLGQRCGGPENAPTYYCVDTVRGFTDVDIRVERQRGKTEGYKSISPTTPRNGFSEPWKRLP